MNYKDLNDRQSEALLQTEGPVLILAGAGSGKTKVVTSKIAYLIEEKNVYPSNILAITFTNKAASEMKERVSNLIDVDVDAMWIGTFHAICLRILRRNIDRISYSSNFSIYDRDDQNTVVRDCIKELDLNKDVYKNRGIIAKISELKNEGILPDEFINSNHMDFYNRNVGEVYALYEKKLKENNALDFDDLIIKTVDILKENKDIRDYYQNKFQYIFVDEYQDTNAIQYKLIKLLCRENPNLTVVGDNDQSIYKWRGADIGNILNFEKDFENATVVLLEQNYRSTSNILKVANAVIRNNPNRKDKRLWTDRDDGRQVSYQQYGHSQEEERDVVNKILQFNYKGYAFSDMAILYRTNAQSRGFEEALVRERVPYKIVGGLKFYDRKEVKDIIAYLTVIQNSNDNVAVTRIINVPKRGIGDQTVLKLSEFAIENNLSLYDVVSNLESYEELNLRARKNIREFANLINLLKGKKEELSISQLIEKVIYESGYVAELEAENTVEARTRIENIKELISTAVEYERENAEGSLEDFLSGISLLSEVDKTNPSENGVKLMTVHAAKGLEFKAVFLVGMEEGLFPTSRALESDEDIEEERRLCYVGITRAEEILCISSAQTRTLYGKTSPTLESRFIGEMEDTVEIIKPVNKIEEGHNLVKVRDFTEYNPKVSKMSSSLNKSEGNNKDKNFNIGDKVNHKKWGQGMIVSKTEKNGDYEIVISFNEKGLKKLMLSFAPITLVK
ncbi:ATP-dependent helicase [Anaerosphaera multitolerans]|uniref:ATP-dependent DNA helicase PcrA n=1 Tax=Anaerosphaera multitolerans TaxID=2487351 RepID=A0A437S784_9FIRM|nr:UvrD-helicase domain-containing protein [Anaerosphaera multitolerans]RVU54798.1 ATP-dependent DNA helicase PcrA [Anaerosphaera multitolerans]